MDAKGLLLTGDSSKRKTRQGWRAIFPSDSGATTPLFLLATVLVSLEGLLNGLLVGFGVGVWRFRNVYDGSI